MSLLEEDFGYKTPDKILQTLHNIKRVDSYNQEAFSNENIIVGFEKKVQKMPEGVNRNRGKGILKIVSKILDFNLNERNQRGVGLKILTPNQMLNRLSISLARLKPETILKNLKMKSDNYCILSADQKNLQKTSIKI